MFSGTPASQLNALLRDPSVTAVKVSAPRLDVEEPIRISKPNLRLDLGTAELMAPANGARFLVRVERASGAVLDGGAFVGGQWGALVNEAADVTLRGGRYKGLRHGGIVLTHAAGAVLGRSRFEGLGGAAVLLHGDTVGASVIDNEIIGNLGASNWHAGIVVSDRNAAVAEDPHRLLGPDRHWAIEQPIHQRLHPPRRNLLAFNRIALKASSGIYSDGGIQTVMFHNVIEGNSKEGVCLDNGKRCGKTDAQLKLDFVDGMGGCRTAARAKTPGISLDNALYNIVYANQVDRNHGGGIKMVRTGFFNIVGMNLLTGNNEGANERFHFFGIELGAAPADASASDLDFTPSRGNIVFANTIRGPHYAGIFYGPGSTLNDAFDNSIFGATAWAMEQVRVQSNASLNNLINLPSRNIDSGLDLRLVELAKGRNDR